MEVRLFDLIREVQDACDDDREVVAALEDLLNPTPPPEGPRWFRALVAATSVSFVLLLGASASHAAEETPAPAPSTACPAGPAAAMPSTFETPSDAALPPGAETATSAEDEAR